MPPQDNAGNTPDEQRALDAVMAANAAAVAALLALEARSVAEAAGPYRAVLSDLLRRLAAQWVLIVGGLDRLANPDQARQLIQMLALEIQSLLDIDPATSLGTAAQQGAGLGWEYSTRGMADPPPPELNLSPEVAQIIAETPAAVADAVSQAEVFAAVVPVQSWPDLLLHVSKASQAATAVERRAALIVERAHSDSIQRVAALRGARLLWVAEPDACVVCLALSGHLSDPAVGEWFDEQATFGRPSRVPAVWPPGQPLKGPPRHPYCRCVLELWFGPAVPVGGPFDNALYGADLGLSAGVDLPAALRREAKRSILRGWSLPSESGTVRIEAASRLLARGAGLPRSVEDRAARAVRRGHFDDRTHPSRRSPRR